MKKIYILIITIVSNITFSFSQVTTVVDGIFDTDRLLLVDDVLYYSHGNTISYININEDNPSPTVLISNLNDPSGMEIKDNFLYLAHFGDGDVVKLDLNDPSPSLIDVTFFGNTPNMLKFNGNDLFFTDNNGNRIYKYDITSGSPTAEVFLNRYRPIGIEIKDNFVYFTETPGKIMKIDINNTDSYAEPIELVSGLQGPIGLEFKGDDLFIAEMSAGRIVKINVTESPVTLEEVVVNLTSPIDLTFDGDTMYICEYQKISKIDLSLSVDEYSFNTIVLSPNPANDFLTVSNLTSDLDFTIYDVNGRVLQNGKISPNSKIDISYLTRGCYFINFEGVSIVTKKFIKE